jgi:hypothetical protein
MNVLFELMTGFALNFTVGFIIIRFIYYTSNPKQQIYIFTFFAFNILIYFVSALLRDVQLSIGFGFGLLAVFSTLRYRTRRIPIKEMTYLFISMTVPFMNTLFMATRINYTELILINLMIITLLYIIAKRCGVQYEVKIVIRYEKIELIKPEHYQQLLEDLQQRTGLNIKRVEVGGVDFLRDTAQLTIYCDEIAAASQPDVIKDKPYEETLTSLTKA